MLEGITDLHWIIFQLVNLSFTGKMKQEILGTNIFLRQPAGNRWVFACSVNRVYCVGKPVSYVLHKTRGEEKILGSIGLGRFSFTGADMEQFGVKWQTCLRNILITER